MQHQKNTKNKRITPDDKKGGLPKIVFEQKQHFSSFMEKLSAIRQEKNQTESKSTGSQNTIHSMGEILNTLKFPKK